MTDKRDKFKSSIGFTDMLFNLLVGFVFLFVIAFILINPPVKKSDAPKKAEYIITLEWDNDSYDDVDLWVKEPGGGTVSYQTREQGSLNLEKDDLGRSNDFWRKPDGSIEEIRLNREVITIRGIQEGRFQVAVHIYSRRTMLVTPTNGKPRRVPATDGPGNITVSLIKINPYGEVYKVNREYSSRGQVFTAFNFVLDKNGNVTAIDEIPNRIVLRGGSRVQGQ
jgi:hypothetical protein